MVSEPIRTAPIKRDRGDRDASIADADKMIIEEVSSGRDTSQVNAKILDFKLKSGRDVIFESDDETERWLLLSMEAFEGEW